MLAFAKNARIVGINAKAKFERAFGFKIPDTNHKKAVDNPFKMCYT